MSKGKGAAAAGAVLWALGTALGIGVGWMALASGACIPLALGAGAATSLVGGIAAGAVQSSLEKGSAEPEPELQV